MFFFQSNLWIFSQQNSIRILLCIITAFTYRVCVCVCVCVCGLGRVRAPASITTHGGNPWVAVLYTWALVQVSDGVWLSLLTNTHTHTHTHKHTHIHTTPIQIGREHV